MVARRYNHIIYEKCQMRILDAETSQDHVETGLIAVHVL